MFSMKLLVSMLEGSTRANSGQIVSRDKLYTYTVYALMIILFTVHEHARLNKSCNLISDWFHQQAELARLRLARARSSAYNFRNLPLRLDPPTVSIGMVRRKCDCFSCIGCFSSWFNRHIRLSHYVRKNDPKLLQRSIDGSDR